MIDAQELLNALALVIDATNEHDNCHRRYQGYSWDYHGAGLIYARDKARADFMERLDAYVDARIAAALSRGGGNA